MTIQGGDVISLSTGGVFEIASVASGSRPTTPTISSAVSGQTVTITIDGDSGVTNYLKYMRVSDSSWIDGGSRSGDGDISVADLSDDTVYVFVVHSENDEGVVSLTSTAAVVTLTESTDNTFDTQVESDASVFLDKFGEDIIYYPAGGGSREIVGIVDRQPSEVMEGLGVGAAPVKQISVANSSTIGISTGEINTGGDKIGVSNRIGAAAVSRRILAPLISQDHGMIVFEVQ